MEERMQQARAAPQVAQPQPAAAVPPQEQHPELWDKFGGMLDGKIDRLGNQFALAMRTMEKRLTGKIGTDASIRADENANMASRIDEVVAKLESGWRAAPRFRPRHPSA